MPLRLVEKILTKFGRSTQMRFYLEVKDYRELSRVSGYVRRQRVGLFGTFENELLLYKVFLIKRCDT